MKSSGVSPFESRSFRSAPVLTADRTPARSSRFTACHRGERPCSGAAMLPAALKMPLTTLVRTARTGLTSPLPPPPLLAWALMVVRLLLGRGRVEACKAEWAE